MVQRSKGEKIFNVFNYIFLAVLSFTTLYPFLYTLTISISTRDIAGTVGFHVLPTWGKISFDAYNLVFQNELIWTAYGYTIFRTVVGTVLSVLVTCFYGYAISRPNLVWKKFFVTFLMITTFFSGGQIPAYLNIKDLGLIDNVWVYILPALVTAYYVIIARSFFSDLPEALNESAKIDGAGEFRIFFKIIVPLSKPVIMTLALWIAVNHWNSWFDSMMYMTNSKKAVVQEYIRRIVNEATDSMTDVGADPNAAENLTPDTVRSASIMVTVIPILSFYPFIQRYFIKGVTLGAVKG